MKYALIGYGKMGRAIDALASARGHQRVGVVDRSARVRRVARTIGDASWRGVSVAFEFTEPGAAHRHVVTLLRRGVAVVCGTTGWDATDPEVRRAARASTAGAVIAPNFSIGVSLFYAVVADAARRYLAVDSYDPWIVEWHHRAKMDAPSGTARRLAMILAEARPVPAGREVAVSAVRAGHEAGHHVVGFDGPHDAVTLSHAARGREGFAEGAVLASEWLQGRRGLHGFDDVLDDLARGPRRRGGRR